MEPMTGEVLMTMTDGEDGMDSAVHHIILTADEFKALVQDAAAQRRTPAAQAAVLISEGLGLWQTAEPKTTESRPTRVRPSRAKVKTGGQG